ncbi:MAG: LPS export ABC transporter permease LptF [Desulfobacterales bacterium]
MRKPSIISRYVILEMIPPFGITLVFFAFVFMMTSLLDLTHLIINYRIGLLTVCKMLLYSMPFFLEFIVPMAVMMAVLMTFLRMSSDNEIVALKAGGVSIYRLLGPALLFCLAGFMLTGAISLAAMPWGKGAFRKTLVQVATRHFDIALKERTFNESFKGMVMFVNRVDLKNRKLVDIFIEDRTQKDTVSTIVAPEGRIFKSQDGLSGRLRLFNGSIHHADLEAGTVHFVEFDTYDFNLDLRQAASAAAAAGPDKEEMSVGELRNFLRGAKEKDERYYAALIELHERFSIPFACFALGLLAFPLGLQPMEGRRAFGLVIGLFFFTLYYLMLIVGWSFGESGVYPPALGMWIPNGVMAGIGLILLVRTARERPVRIDTMVMAVRRLVRRRPDRGRF